MVIHGTLHTLFKRSELKRKVLSFHLKSYMYMVNPVPHNFFVECLKIDHRKLKMSNVKISQITYNSIIEHKTDSGRKTEKRDVLYHVMSSI